MKSLLLTLLFLGIGIPGNAKDKEPEKKPADEKAPEKPVELVDQAIVTDHVGVFGGSELPYYATAGTMVINKAEDKTKAAMFYVAYTAKGVKDPATRPIVFCFNGGPGSSGVWLHLGGFGPKRVAMKPDGTMPAPPFTLADNPASLLRVADLVFIDPVSTGFSRVEDKEKAGEFHGFEGDLDSMAEFIRLYTTREGRWLSPKFLAGESYGSLRAAALAQVLHQKFGLYLNGIVLVSGVLNFETLFDTDTAAVAFLPAMSEVAAYHEQLGPDLMADAAARRAEVEAFASGDYATALLRGTALPAEEKTALAERIARYTSIDPTTVERHDLRIPPSFFQEELLREKGLVIGRFDARITGTDGVRAGIAPEYDPSYAAVYGPFSATLNDYLRRDLKFESDLVYEILSSRVRPWNYGDDFVGQPISVLDRLAQVMSQNPSLRVLVNCGYQDLATPATAIRHSLDHLKIDPSLRSNISYTFYEGGHMMYTIEASNAAWNADVAKFVSGE